MTLGAFLCDHAAELIQMGVLLALSSLFSGSETALFNLTRGQLHRLGRSGGAGRRVATLMARPRRVLNTLLFGNMLANVAYAGLSAVVVLDLRRSGQSATLVAVASLAPVLLLILLGEVAPKVLAYVMCERWASVAAAPLAVVGRIAAPVVWVLERGMVGPLTRVLAPRRAGRAEATAEELAEMLHLSAKRGIIAHNASELLREIVELTDLHVGDIMVPRVDMIAYDVDAPPGGLLQLFRETRLRKIPVYEDQVDHVVGLVHAKRLFLQPDTPLRELVMPTVFVPEAANVERLLFQLRLKQTQVAVVVDEYGGTAGLVTLQDALGEIVGDLPDPNEPDEAPAVQEIGPRTYMLNANLAIHEWGDAFGIDLSRGRISTVGGFVTSLLGRIARVGDVVSHGNIRFTVESMRGRRVGKLHLELVEQRP